MNVDSGISDGLAVRDVDRPLKPPSGFVLPDHVWRAFHTLSRFGEGPRPDIGRSERSQRLVACWMAATGWTAKDLVLAIEQREAGREPVSRFDVGRWARREEEAASWLALGQYLVFGTPPPDGQEGERVRSAIKYGTPSRGLPRLTNRHLADYLAAIVGLFDPGGRTARTDRLVLQQLAAIALDAGTIAPAPGVRRLATDVGMRYQTVLAAISRLAADGVLLKLGARLSGQPASYLIRLPVRGARTVTTTDLCSGLGPDESCSARGTLTAGHPAFHRDALGKTGHGLLACLANGRPQTDSEWWTAAGVSRRTFYRLKSRLVGEHGEPLAVFTESGWRLAEDLQLGLDRVAEESGTVELHRRRDVRTDNERVGFGSWRIRSLGTQYRAVDSVRAVEIETGEVIPIDGLIDDFGHPRDARAATAPSAGPDRRPPRRACAACGVATSDVDSVSGLSWHAACRMPLWIARHLGRVGVVVPPDRLAEFAPVVDRFGDDWAPAESLNNRPLAA